MNPRTIEELRGILGAQGLVSSPEELRTYECDGLTNFHVIPSAVVLPDSTEQVQAVVRVCHRERIPFVAARSDRKAVCQHSFLRYTDAPASDIAK